MRKVVDLESPVRSVKFPEGQFVLFQRKALEDMDRPVDGADGVTAWFAYLYHP